MEWIKVDHLHAGRAIWRQIAAHGLDRACSPIDCTIDRGKAFLGSCASYQFCEQQQCLVIQECMATGLGSALVQDHDSFKTEPSAKLSTRAKLGTTIDGGCASGVMQLNQVILLLVAAPLY